jgi:hypothetical protein
MTTLFLNVCTISAVFFVVFLVECSKPRRKARTKQVARKSVEAEVIEPPAGNEFLTHVEQQMADFLVHHGRTVA